jgi:hypothetical protein
MKNRPLQKPLKKCAVFFSISLFAMVASADAHGNKARPAWNIPVGKTAIKNKLTATQGKITGTVTDEKNLPLPGVSIKIKAPPLVSQQM